MDKAFFTAFRLLMILEGDKKVVDDPNDPGGITKYGISIRFLLDHRIDLTGDGIVTAEDILALTRDDARRIYLQYFWGPLRCRSMWWPMAPMVFTFGVHSGIRTAALGLQRSINAVSDAGLKEDGVIGPVTLSALEAADRVAMMTVFPAIGILAHYRKARKWDHYYDGWVNRLIKQAHFLAKEKI